jgi:hypothetical protein
LRRLIAAFPLVSRYVASVAKPKLATLTLAPFRLAFGIEVLIRRPQDATILAFKVIFITFIFWRDAGEMECSKRNLLRSQRLPFLQTGHQGLVLGLLLFFVCSVLFCFLFLLLFLLAIQNLLFAFCLNKSILVNLMIM